MTAPEKKPLTTIFKLHHVRDELLHMVLKPRGSNGLVFWIWFSSCVCLKEKKDKQLLTKNL